MIRQEDIYFFEDNCISVEKFLDMISVSNGIILESKTRKGKKSRIKHSQLRVLPGVINVPLNFAHRSKELVSCGKVLIVRDNYGVYRAYLNPKVICDYKSFDPDTMTAWMLKEELASLEEDERLVRCFDTEKDLATNPGYYGEAALTRRKNR